MTQLTLDLFTERINPITCPHAQPLLDLPKIVFCHHPDGGWYTNCQKSVCGQEPQCALEKPDNSPQAVARRLEWMRENGKDSQAIN
jgi:hypothetical protein